MKPRIVHPVEKRGSAGNPSGKRPRLPGPLNHLKEELTAGGPMRAPVSGEAAVARPASGDAAEPLRESPGPPKGTMTYAAPLNRAQERKKLRAITDSP